MYPNCIVQHRCEPKYPHLAMGEIIVLCRGGFLRGVHPSSSGYKCIHKLIYVAILCYTILYYTIVSYTRLYVIRLWHNNANNDTNNSIHHNIICTRTNDS